MLDYVYHSLDYHVIIVEWLKATRKDCMIA